MITQQQDGDWLQTEGWQEFSGLVHGFSQRIVDRNVALQKIHAENLSLHTLRQVHSDHIVSIKKQAMPLERTEADGLISSETGALLGISTADCVPVLMVDPGKNVVVALHAGWRGTLKGISWRAIAMLRTQWDVAAQDLHVALGPAIGGCCYEVGSEVGEAIVKRWDTRSVSAWRPHGTKGFLDLRVINAAQITESGVPQERIRFTGPCTFCDPAFASYRREGSTAGRQLSVIGWR